MLDRLLGTSALSVAVPAVASALVAISITPATVSDAGASVLSILSIFALSITPPMLAFIISESLTAQVCP